MELLRLTKGIVEAWPAEESVVCAGGTTAGWVDGTEMAAGSESETGEVA